LSSELLIVADQQIAFVAEAFSVFGEVRLCKGREITSAIISDADVLLVRSVTPVNEALLKGSRVWFVGSATSGTDHIDRQYLADNNIRFVHAPGSNARSVAEYVLSCLMVLQAIKSVRLNELTVGIIGCGHVGSMLHQFLEVLDVPYLLNDPPLRDERDDPHYRPLHELFQADVISLHVPLSREGHYPTYRLVDANFLAHCKSGMTLINTSRGAVVDEAALLKHLNTDNSFKIMLDVWEHEPEINRDLLAKSLIGTPHIAGYSLEGKVLATKILYQALAEMADFDVRHWCSSLSMELTDKIVLKDSEESIQQAILSHYDVREDSNRLKDMFLQQRERGGDYFDMLRKKYPARREFTSSTIQLSRQDDAQEKMLSGLGFRVNH